MQPYQRFIDVVKTGNIEMVEQLLQDPQIVAAVAENNNQALLEAASHGHLAVVNLLLKYPAVVDAIAIDNNRALHGATFHGHLAVVNRLLEYPAVVDIIAIDNNGALRGAVSNGHLDVVNRLLECPAVVNAIAADNNGILIEAAYRGHFAIVNRLLEYPAVKNAIAARNNRALYGAVSNRHFEVVDQLLEYPGVTTHTSFSALCDQCPYIKEKHKEIANDRMNVLRFARSYFLGNPSPDDPVSHSVLPLEILHHILSFVPSVQTRMPTELNPRAKLINSIFDCAFGTLKESKNNDNSDLNNNGVLLGKRKACPNK